MPVLSINILQLFTNRKSLSHYEPCQVQGMVVASHELIHLSQFDHLFYIEMSYFSPYVTTLVKYMHRDD
jgi:hypothetical protein